MNNPSDTDTDASQPSTIILENVKGDALRMLANTNGQVMLEDGTVQSDIGSSNTETNDSLTTIKVHPKIEENTGYYIAAYSI